MWYLISLTISIKKDETYGEQKRMPVEMQPTHGTFSSTLVKCFTALGSVGGGVVECDVVGDKSSLVLRRPVGHQYHSYQAGNLKWQMFLKCL